MYYEESIIDGVLHWRGTPDGEWRSFTPEQLADRARAPDPTEPMPPCCDGSQMLADDYECKGCINCMYDGDDDDDTDGGEEMARAA